MPLTPLLSGDPERIAGYHLTGRLGSGGQGIVYQGQGDHGHVAVKALHATWLADPSARGRLAREVDSARRVAPFCTARVLEADLECAQPYVVSEFIPGPSLAQQVRSEGPLAGTPLDRLAVGTMTALLAIHQAGLVHRDLKPDNVILGPDGPRVVDFGIARDVDTNLTGTGQILGTPAFMAPEQVNGHPAGPAADVFSWAVTMVFAATGVSPFDGGQLTATLYRVVSAPVDLSRVPPQLAAVLDPCLAKDPAARPDAQQVLLRLVGGQPPARDGDGAQALIARAATMVGQPLGATAVQPPGVPDGATMPSGPYPGHAAAGPQGPGPQPAAPAGRRPRSGAGTAAPGGRGGAQPWWFLPAVVTSAVALLLAVGLVVWDRVLAPEPGPLTVGQGAKVPGDFSGEWVGTLTRNSQHWPALFVLREGATLGEMTAGECRYVATVGKVSDDGLTLTLVSVLTAQPTSVSCSDVSEVTLTRPKEVPSGSALTLDVRAAELSSSSSDPSVGSVTRR